jgi:hypothetical protein
MLIRFRDFIIVIENKQIQRNSIEKHEFSSETDTEKEIAPTNVRMRMVGRVGRLDTAVNITYFMCNAIKKRGYILPLRFSASVRNQHGSITAVIKGLK